MPRYYFDLHDGKSFFPDHFGLVFACNAKARMEALAALAQLAQELVASGDDAIAWLIVRSADKKFLFRVSLSYRLDMDWLT